MVPWGYNQQDQEWGFFFPRKIQTGPFNKEIECLKCAFKKRGKRTSQ